MNTAPLEWQARDVDPTTIERQLSNLWKRLPVGAANRSAVRTHMFNLVAYAENKQQLDRISRLAGLSRCHPSRTIIVQGERSHGDPSVDASISLNCIPSHEGTASYCHEEIVLAAHGRAADHLGSVIIPLLQPEIPTYLWWPGQPPFGYRLFHRLLGVGDHLIVDSAEFSDPGDGLSQLAGLCATRFGINDFNWSRLTPWREIIAPCFDGPAMLPYLQSIRSIKLGFGMSPAGYARATAGLLLLLGWFSSRLGWEAETTLDRPPTGDVTMSVLQENRLILIDLVFSDHGSAGAGRLMSLEIVSTPPDRPPGRFHVRRDEGLGNVEVAVELHGECPIIRVLPLGIRSDDQLLAQELELAGTDVLYAAVVHEASLLAGRDVEARA